MKFPNIQYSDNVKPFAPVNPWAPVKAMQSNLAQLSTVAEVTNTLAGIYDGIEKDKAVQAYGVSVTAMADAEAKAAINPNPLERPNMLRERAIDLDGKAKETLSPTAYRHYNAAFRNKSAGMINSFTVKSAIEANTVQRKSFAEEVIGIATKGDYQSASDMIDDSTMFSDAEKIKLRSDARMSTEIGTVERVKYSNNPLLITSVLENMASEGYTGPLEGNQREAAIKDLQNALSVSTAERNATIAHERGRIYGDLKLAVNQGKAGLVEIDRAYDDYPEVITEARRADLMTTADNYANKKRKNAELNGLVEWSLLNGEPLNNKNTDHNKAVNMYYEKNPTFDLGIKLAAKTNIMPDLMEDEFRRLAFLGKPEKVLKITNAYEILERESPLSLENVGTKQNAIYGTVSSLYRGGVPLDEAVEIARENAAKPEEEKMGLGISYRTLTRENPPLKRLESQMDKSDLFDISISPFGAPSTPSSLAASYSALEMEYYKNTNGDVDMAAELAFRHVSRVFSSSEINDKDQVFAYAPERVTGLSTKYLRKDLKKQAKDFGLDPEKVMIVPDATTGREKGIKSYPIYSIDRFNNPNPTEYRWTPDVSRYHKERKAKAVKARKSLEESRKGGYFPAESYVHIDVPWGD